MPVTLLGAPMLCPLPVVPKAAILLIRFSRGRIQGADEISKGLIAHALHTPLLCAEEHSVVLLGIPEQRSLPMSPLAFCTP